MPLRETGKQRASRIPLDYFKRPDRLARTKLALTVVALAVTVGWWASGFLWSDDARLRYSHGPLTAVHATWETQCDACHVAFTPISGQNLLVHGAASMRTAEANCENCHAGPVHHAIQKPEDVVGCGGCHRDHRGKDVSLVRLPNSDCTSCHTQLPRHLVAGAKTTFANVSQFDVNHPEFKLLREHDPKPSHFSFHHAMHTTPGLKLQADAKSWTLADVRDPHERERLRAQQPPELRQDSDGVVLSCAACHQLDRGTVTGTTQPGRPSGAYYLPIRYDLHCRACHPLTFDSRNDMAGQAMPHGLQADQVREFLWGAYVARAVRDPQVQQRIRRPLPGQELQAEEEKARKEVDGQVGAAEKFLYKDSVTLKEQYLHSGKTTCGECHQYERAPGSILPKRIVPPDIPNVWFTHASFDHLAHRAVDCAACHRPAYANPDVPVADRLLQREEPLLPGIATCRTCHAPPHTEAGQRVGGARHGCTECHRYHNGDAPQQGAGAPARGALHPGEITQFLSGKLTGGTAKPPR